MKKPKKPAKITILTPAKKEEEIQTAACIVACGCNVKL